MSWKFNPFTGRLDVADGASGWVFNPFTGTLDARAIVYGWQFNPFTGALDLLGSSVTPPPPSNAGRPIGLLLALTYAS